MLDTSLLRPSLYCNTSLRFTTLHPTTLHFLSFTLHYPLIRLNPITLPIVRFHLTSLDTTLSRNLTAGTGKNHVTSCKDSVYNKTNTRPSSSKPSDTGSVEKAQEARVWAVEKQSWLSPQYAGGRTGGQRLPTETFTDRRKQKE